MSDTNRVRLTGIAESVLGTTPGTPRMRGMRFTSEGLAYEPSYTDSAEIRSDRMNVDPIKTGEAFGGDIAFEYFFPTDGSLFSHLHQSVFYNPWTNTPFRDNDGTADSVITQVTAASGTIACATAAAFVTGQLVRNTGFTNAANNGLFRCTTGSATAPVFASQGLVDEAAPPAAARMKVVGFQGASGDITATASGLGSTSLNFTTLGLAVGQWIKIGGTGSGFRFATEALNGWARITAIAATALTLDNRPDGWTTDSGTSKTIRVYVGDQIKNGTTRHSATLEKGAMSQSVPTYQIGRGCIADTLALEIAAGAIITGSMRMMGMTGAVTTTSLDDTPDEAPTGRAMAAGPHVGRIALNGSAVASPNWVRSANISITNNVRMINAVGSVSGVDMGVGEVMVEGTLVTYFGSNSLQALLLADSPISYSARVERDSQAMVFQLPRITLKSGRAEAGGKNQDLTLSMGFSASRDSVTSAAVIFDRFEYFEA